MNRLGRLFDQLSKSHKADNQSFLDFIEHYPGLVGIWDEDTYCVALSPDWEKVLGIPREEITGYGWKYLVIDEDIEKTIEAIPQIKEQPLNGFVNRWKTAAGEPIALEWRTSPWCSVSHEYTICVARVL